MRTCHCQHQHVYLFIYLLNIIHSGTFVVDNLQLNSLNSPTHLLTTDTDEKNVKRHSLYISDDELIQSCLHNTNGLSILSLNCQSLHAKLST